MKHGSFWSVSLLFASYCTWQVDTPFHTPFPCLASTLIYIFVTFQCFFCVLNFSVANTIISEESYFRINGCWNISDVQRKQQETKDSALWGHQTKPGPNPILLRLQQLVDVCSTEKKLSISVSSHLCYNQTVCSEGDHPLGISPLSRDFWKR